MDPMNLKDLARKLLKNKYTHYPINMCDEAILCRGILAWFDAEGVYKEHKDHALTKNDQPIKCTHG